MGQDMDGIEMGKTFATSKIPSRRKEVVSITHLLSLFNLNMITAKFIWLIAIHTLTQTVQSSFRDCASQRAKTVLERP